MEKDKKKGSLKIIIAVIIALVVLAGIVICVIMHGKNSSSKKSNKNVKEADTPQEEAIVILFNAINSYDRDKINELCDPTGENPVIASGMSTGAVYMHNFRFYKSIIEIDDRVRTDQEIMDLYYESYGFSSFREGGPEEYREVSQDNKKYEKKFDDFKADYELVSMKKADEYTVSLRNRLDYEEIDLQEYIGDKYDIEVGDVYVATIKASWKYGDKEYGFDKDWWDNDHFVEILGNYRGNFGGDTYNKVIRYYEKKKYNLVIYEYKDDWYILNPYFIAMQETATMKFE